MPTNEKETQIIYTVIFEPSEEGGYIVRVPALPGCVTQGDTIEEAREMAKDAIKGCIAVLREDGHAIPQDIKIKPAYEKIKISLHA